MKTLVSKYRGLRLIVEPSESRIDPQRGPVVTKPATVVKFSNGVAEVSDDVAKIVKTCAAYTGERGEKMVWFSNDEDSPAAGGEGAVRVSNGMQTGNSPRSPEPIEGWDGMTVKDIQQALATGRISNFTDALEYESRTGGRRRSGVIKALAAKLAGDDEPAPKQRSAAPDETFSASAPAGSDK